MKLPIFSIPLLLALCYMDVFLSSMSSETVSLFSSLKMIDQVDANIDIKLRH